MALLARRPVPREVAVVAEVAVVPPAVVAVVSAVASVAVSAVHSVATDAPELKARKARRESSDPDLRVVNSDPELRAKRARDASSDPESRARKARDASSDPESRARKARDVSSDPEPKVVRAAAVVPEDHPEFTKVKVLPSRVTRASLSLTERRDTPMLNTRRDASLASPERELIPMTERTAPAEAEVLPRVALARPTGEPPLTRSLRAPLLRPRKARPPLRRLRSRMPQLRLRSSRREDPSSMRRKKRTRTSLPLPSTSPPRSSLPLRRRPELTKRSRE